MVNDPLPFQLTVAQLREALVDAQDGAVVSLRLKAGFSAHPSVDRVYNLRVAHSTAHSAVFAFDVASERP